MADIASELQSTRNRLFSARRSSARLAAMLELVLHEAEAMHECSEEDNCVAHNIFAKAKELLKRRSK